MNRRFVNIVIAMLMVPMALSAQTYSELWRQVDDAQAKDLPQTAMSMLKKIEVKAEKEKSYGQLLKSALLISKLQAEVAPDSLQPAVERLEQKEQESAGDVALQAVYCAVLAKLYQQNHQIDDNWEKKYQSYRDKAKAHPDALAAAKTKDYEPFVVKGDDTPFVMELPPYRIPTGKAMLRHTWEKGKQYLKKMGGIILVASIIVWALGYFPHDETLTKQQQQEQSYIGHLGKAIEPIFSPQGFTWKLDVGLIAGV